MKTAYISDVHGNLEALEVVLADIESRDVGRIVCLGDIVGYGPDPNECVARVREACVAVVAGNHDHAALGRIDTFGFNEYAKEAADWTSNALNEESRLFLSALPLATVLDDRLLVHASPKDPERWTYVLSFEEAERQFQAFDQTICFLGHSHLPIVIEYDESKVTPIPFEDAEIILLQSDRRYIVNVGSVGQPRDRDPRAGYVIHDEDTDEIALFRLDYPIEVVQKKIADAGLPAFLARRLEAGV